MNNWVTNVFFIFRSNPCNDLCKLLLSLLCFVWRTYIIVVAKQSTCVFNFFSFRLVLKLCDPSRRMKLDMLFR
jgi:hypothetical protein